MEDPDQRVRAVWRETREDKNSLGKRTSGRLESSEPRRRLQNPGEGGTGAQARGGNV